MLCCKERLRKMGYTSDKKYTHVEEGLPNFFKALEYSEACKYIEVEKRMRKKFGLPLDEPQLIHKLKKVKVPH